MDRSGEGRAVALVTGGSRGIGRAVVLELARNAHDIAFCYRANDDAARAVEHEAKGLGAHVITEKLDVKDGAVVRRFVDAVERELGRIDVAVTSAGITRDAPLAMMKDTDWRDVLETNLDGTFEICRAVVVGMMKRGTGCIVNISSTVGVYGNASQTNYAASKAGILGFSRSLAKEVGRFGIRVNVVAPGYIETDMTAVLSESVARRAIEHVPLRRFGQAQDVAYAVAFLASEKARYVTGAALQVDGGVVL